MSDEVANRRERGSHNALRPFLLKDHSILATTFNENNDDLKSNLCFGYLQCFNRRHILEGVSIEAKKDVETHVT